MASGSASQSTISFVAAALDVTQAELLKLAKKSCQITLDRIRDKKATLVDILNELRDSYYDDLDSSEVDKFMNDLMQESERCLEETIASLDKLNPGEFTQEWKNVIKFDIVRLWKMAKAVETKLDELIAEYTECLPSS